MKKEQNTVSKTESLTEEIRQKLKLLRALANFHIDSADSAEAIELENQRSQLLRVVRELELQFEKLAGSENKSSAVPGAELQLNETDQAGLISRFIQAVVPRNMLKAWRPDSFTGTLTVFFANGSVGSSSLVAQDSELQFDSVPDDEVEGSFAISDLTVERQAAFDPAESFTVLKSLVTSGVDIYFHLSQPATVFIRIYDESRRPVREVEKNYSGAGDYTVRWDRSDNKDKILPDALFFCQLQVGNTVSEMKEIDLR